MILLSFLFHRHYFMTAGSFQLFHFLWDANDKNHRIQNDIVAVLQLEG